MLPQLKVIILAIAFTISTIANPARQAEEAWLTGPRAENSSKQPSNRPSIFCFPKTPSMPLPNPPPRTRICYVQSHGDGTDDSSFILSALHGCNNSGHVVFEEGVRYEIGTALDLTFLNHIDIDIQGYIQFSNDTTYWHANSFKFVFQNVTSFFKLGGNDVSICGGTIDGNGQVWYDLYAKDIYTLRPVLIGIDGLSDSVVSDLVLRYSPQYYHFIANASNVIFDNINISGGSTNSNSAKNTDGWDTYRSSGLVIQNSYINNGDDCVSFKPNSTDILVQNLFCNGSHDISVGSLGQYVGGYDIVENVYVYNVSMHNGTDGARRKVWPNSPTALSGDLQGGGGNCLVKNITYNTMSIDNVDYAIEIDQCYGQSNLTLSLQYPSPLTITDILFENFSGKTSKKYQPEIGTFACSSPAACRNIVARDIDVTSPNVTDLAFCLNVEEGLLDVQCSGEYLGFN